MPIKEKNIGVTFVNQKEYEFQQIKYLCETYVYENKINKWFVIVVRNDFIYFEQFYYDTTL